MAFKRSYQWSRHLLVAHILLLALSLPGEAQFVAEACAGPGMGYDFRVRARAEQPPGSNGAWPNHRYPGDWSAAQAVAFPDSAPCALHTILPLILR